MEGNTHKRKFSKKRFYLKKSKQFNHTQNFLPQVNIDDSYIAAHESENSRMKIMDPFFSQSSTQTDLLLPLSTESHQFKIETTEEVANQTFSSLGLCEGTSPQRLETFDVSVKLPQKRVYRKDPKPLPLILTCKHDQVPPVLVPTLPDPTCEIEVSNSRLPKSESFIQKIKSQAKTQKLNYTFVKGFLLTEPEDSSFTVQAPRHLEGFTHKKPATSFRESLFSSLRSQINSRKTIHLEYEDILSKPVTDLPGIKKAKISENPSQSTSFSTPIFTDLHKSDFAIESVSTIDSSPGCLKDFEQFEKMTNLSQSGFDEKSEIFELEKDDLGGLAKRLDFSDSEIKGKIEEEVVDEEEIRKISLMKERRGIQLVRKMRETRKAVGEKDLEYLSLIQKPDVCVRTWTFLNRE